MFAYRQVFISKLSPKDVSQLFQQKLLTGGGENASQFIPAIPCELLSPDNAYTNICLEGFVFVQQNWWFFFKKMLLQDVAKNICLNEHLTKDIYHREREKEIERDSEDKFINVDSASNLQKHS